MKKADISKVIDAITKQIVEKYKPEKIILFGSANRQNNEVNDIDLFIIKKDVPHYGADRISELFTLLDVDAAIDYIIYKPAEVEERLALGDPFIKKILNEGKVLYG